MTAFNVSEIPVFMTKWGAEFYAWRARRRGFKTEISSYSNWFICGGNYGVRLSK
jgi:hypothetical protein